MSVQHQGAIASIHLVYMHVSVYAGACVSECVRYRPGENNYVYGYTYKCMLVFVTANKCTHFFSHFFSSFS